MLLIMHENDPDILFTFVPERNGWHIPSIPRGIPRGLAIAGTLTLALAGCWQVQEGFSADSVMPEVAAATAYPSETTGLPSNVGLPPETTAPITTEAPATTFTEVKPATTSTTEAPPTTTTSPPPQPWEERLYVEKDCNDPNSLEVVVQGEGGVAVGAQVSVDYWMGTHKVDSNGQEIPSYEGYSDFVYINPNVSAAGSAEGTRNVCFVAPPGASVYVEVYGKEFTDSEGEISEHPQFGNAMSGQMWPGPNQQTHLNLPRECSAGGSAGAISVRPHSGDIEFTPHRLAAWDDSANVSPGRTMGFGAEDVVFTNEPEIRTLNGLLPNRTYLFQAQFYDANGVSHTAVIPKLPVGPCDSDVVDIDTNLGANTCTASVGGLALSCSFNDRFVG